ncbi:acetylxylan esterase [Desertihabitans brevis]|uniref:Acetylxylan esterase n=1 Tax=Desertihabitans brevis TaxID=2268447 RepID=A0A367YTI9_9ACTN|nr:acetylxylan esterase [Desertihabitans brevis]RCK69110.1 acetylxylan esterase [Desertihabitans brevis]
MAEFDLPLEQLRAYRPDVVEPEDFDASWAATLSAARAHHPLRSVEPVENGLETIRTLDVELAGYAGQPVRAWFSRPAPIPGEAPRAAVVEFLGYGRGRGLPHERITWAAAGYAHLVVDTRGQGGQHGNGGDTPDPSGAGPSAPGFLTRGVLDPEEHYYRRLVTDAARAVDAVRQLPGVDPDRVAVVGNSQGGALALAAAALRPEVSAVLAGVPFLCHPRRALALTDADPWAEVVRYLAVHRDAEEAVLRTLSYVDGVNFARRVRSPAHLSVGLRDTVCPPSTVFAAFNHLGTLAPSPAERTIEVYRYNGHEGGDAVHVRRQLDWLRDRVPPR